MEDLMEELITKLIAEHKLPITAKAHLEAIAATETTAGASPTWISEDLAHSVEIVSRYQNPTEALAALSQDIIRFFTWGSFELFGGRLESLNEHESRLKSARIPLQPYDFFNKLIRIGSTYSSPGVAHAPYKPHGNSGRQTTNPNSAAHQDSQYHGYKSKTD